MPNKHRAGVTFVSVGLDESQIERLDRHIAEFIAEHPGVTYNRSSAMRAALEAYLPKEKSAKSAKKRG